MNENEIRLYIIKYLLTAAVAIAVTVCGTIITCSLHSDAATVTANQFEAAAEHSKENAAMWEKMPAAASVSPEKAR